MGQRFQIGGESHNYVLVTDIHIYVYSNWIARQFTTSRVIPAPTSPQWEGLHAEDVFCPGGSGEWPSCQLQPLDVECQSGRQWVPFLKSFVWLGRGPSPRTDTLRLGHWAGYRKQSQDNRGELSSSLTSQTLGTKPQQALSIEIPCTQARLTWDWRAWLCWKSGTLTASCQD